MQIENKKVLVREPTEQDEQSFIDAVKKCASFHHPWVSPPNNTQDYRKYLEQFASDNQSAFLVIDKESNEFVGVFNISNIVGGCFQSAFLGYYSLLPDIKKGYMTEALSLVINYAFFSLKLHRIEANIQPLNTSSIKLVKRLGFVEEGYAKNYLKINGLWKDHVHYALTLERAQEFWIEQAHDKSQPWLPDFEFKAQQLYDFLKEKEPEFESMATPLLLDHGWDNDVYLVGETIFRCPRRKIAATLIERENIALDYLRGKLNLRIPNPEYKYIGPSFYHVPFHGYKMLDGLPFHKAELTREERIQNISIFSLFLKQLHGEPLQEILEAGLSPQVFDRTKSDSIVKHVENRRDKLLVGTEFKALYGRITTLCQQALNISLDNKVQVLVHGDLYCKHLLIKEKVLCGVIDWGDVGINHPVVDLAALYSLFPSECHETFYDIYGSVCDDVKLFAKFLAVHSALACLDFAISHDDGALKQESMQALSFIVL